VVEFVIMLPLLAMFLFGTFELSRLWLTVGVVAEAAREGARVAAVSGTFSDTAAVARANAVLAAASLTAASGTPTIVCKDPGGTTLTPANCTTTNNAEITATVAVNFVTVVPLLVPWFGESKSVAQTAQMRFE
jgi:Flp pilus assembly protein TadG